MQPTETTKLIITVLNVIILGSLPFWLVWHIKRIKYCEHLSYEWWMQVVISLAYICAISAELPALWSRWKAYYEYHLTVPESLYILTAWDRWSHLLFYVIFMFLTWSITYKRVPKVLTDNFV